MTRIPQKALSHPRRTMTVSMTCMVYGLIIATVIGNEKQTQTVGSMLEWSQILKNRCKNPWKTRFLYHAMPETGATKNVCRFTFLFPEHPLIMSCIFTKFHGNNFHGFKLSIGVISIYKGQ